MRTPPAKSFRDLVVWQKAHSFVLEAYRLSAGFPSREVYGLTAQLRRAVVSVPANIAEGFRRRGRADQVRMLNIAEDSLEESRYCLLLARELSYGHNAALEEQADEVARLLASYPRSIRSPDS